MAGQLSLSFFGIVVTILIFFSNSLYCALLGLWAQFPNCATFSHKFDVFKAFLRALLRDAVFPMFQTVR